MTHENQEESVGEVFRGCAYILLFLLAVTFGAWKLFPLLFNFLASTMSVRWQRDLISVLVVSVCGYGLYFLRQKKRAVYGLVEILFACISSWYAINNIEDKPDITTWLSLAGAIYLTVRGLDNFQVGREELGRDSHLTILGIGKK